MKKISHFIDGKIYSDSKSRICPIFNPAIGEQIAEVELASKSTVEMAIESSSKAFQKWSKTTKKARFLQNSEKSENSKFRKFYDDSDEELINSLKKECDLVLLNHRE